MARIWFVADGVTPKGNPNAEKPLQWCIDNLSLKATDFRGQNPLVINNPTPQSSFANPRWVVIKLEDAELEGIPDKYWKAGFYYSTDISINRVKEHLLRGGKNDHSDV